MWTACSFDVDFAHAEWTFLSSRSGWLFFFAPKDVTLFTAFRRQNRMNAIIMKLTTEEMKEDANPDTSWSEYVAPPVSTLRIGLMKLSVKEVTIPEKAPPIITSIAMSMTLPRRANALNSSINFFIGISP